MGAGHPSLPRARAAGLAPLRRRLLRWYDEHRRELPWRATRDPWAILVSEVMSQQTTVTAVIPYWTRFVQRWPDPVSLARAGRDELLAAWAGLGYYRRAHHLMDAALAVAETGGELPRDAAGLSRLPGVGAYTAAAVASIAYGEPVAVVDGNVERVLSRLFALPGDPRRAPTKRAIAEHAGALLDRRRPGDSNQALMELGATLCRPKEPRCDACPLRGACAARAAGEVRRFPELPPRPALTERAAVAAVVRRGGKVLLRRREGSPNAGFLELPGADLPAERLDRHGRPLDGPGEVSALLAAHGLRAEALSPLPPHRHVIMRWRIRVHPWLATLSSGAVRPPLRWVPADAADVPLTTASRRILSRLPAGSRRKR